jgi:hypothetical protein
MIELHGDDRMSLFLKTSPSAPIDALSGATLPVLITKMIPLKQTLSLMCCFLAPSKGSCFVPTEQHTRTKTSFQLSRADNDCNYIKTAPMVMSIVTAAFLFSGVATAAPVYAYDHVSGTDSSNQLVAARSGGRIGGRSSMGSRAGGYGGSSYTNIRRTTVVRPMVSSPSVIVAPTPLYSPFGFSPFGGFGTWQPYHILWIISPKIIA